MENIKKYAPNLALFVKIVAICYAVLGFFAYILLILLDKTMVLSIIALIGTIVAILALLVTLVITGWVFSIAVDKGYTKSRYAWILFFLPALGWIMVIAMPDLYARPAAPAVEEK